MLNFLVSPVFQFVAPPVAFLVFHVLLHTISRLGQMENPWDVLNVGVHFSVLATSSAFISAVYWAKQAGQVRTGADIANALLAALIVLLISFLVALVICIIDNLLRSQHVSALNARRHRKALAWQALNILIPTMSGFVLFGFVSAQILATSGPI